MAVEETILVAGDEFVFSVGEEALVFDGTVTGAANKTFGHNPTIFEGLCTLIALDITFVMLNITFAMLHLP